ncbi:MAG: hypothetical protein JSV49_07950 [Thermoplasmata archaeon]|nr:MAG: hypothetical protein JSV49_07950 [Thermoplasmata archaeon]
MEETRKPALEVAQEKDTAPQASGETVIIFQLTKFLFLFTNNSIINLINNFEFQIKQDQLKILMIKTNAYMGA